MSIAIFIALSCLLIIIICPTTTTIHAFSLNAKNHHHRQRRSFSLSRRIVHPVVADTTRSSATTGSTQLAAAVLTTDPTVFATGYSTQADLIAALQEAVEMAVSSLPPASADIDSSQKIDLCLVSVSSLYDGGPHQPATVVPTILETLQQRYNRKVQHLIGSSVAGCISSTPVMPTAAAATTASGEKDPAPTTACRPVEWESLPAVSVTLAILPDVQLRTFHVNAADVPDDIGRLPPAEWKRAIGLTGVGGEESTEVESEQSPPIFFLLPSPAFSTELDYLLQGLNIYFPGSQTVGGIASTVSSLSRAKLFQWQAGQQSSSSSTNTYTDGCIGVALQGDIKIRQMTAQGAKAVGGIYQILKGQDSTISVIVLDETATAALEEEQDALDDTEEEVDEEEEEEQVDAKARAAQLYAKARIPKPVLAEANFLMRTLSDDDQAFMRRQLLLGLEQGGSVGRTASELNRLAQGEGHRFTVRQVASAGMKDGSVTLPLGSVDIQQGTRLRFFVRDSDFAKKEIEALWTGYKKQLLNEQFQTDDTQSLTTSFTPACCLVIPTLDRGSKFFMGKTGYESRAVARTLPGVPSIAGFFSNGVIGPVDVGETAKTEVQGSASSYILIGSKSGRPVYSPAAAAAEQAALRERQAAKEAEDRAIAEEDEKRRLRSKSPADADERAPRSKDGELILKRREVHSGRAMTVSTVEWSVAEKTAQPTSTLEGFMWDKETQVDRLRERVPLANLVSQCRTSAADPTAPKPRDWIGPLKQAAAGGFVIIPECKRMEPTTGSLRRRYDVSKLVRQYTMAGVPVISVNCDSVLFGGSLEDITTAREAASSAAVEQMSDDGVVVPPILASDLLLYPYQLYKLRLAGADAVNLVGGALASKDLQYLTKIASSLQLQTLVTVTSEVQLKALSELPADSIDGIIISNRELEDFSFDMTGEQALSLLESDALRELRESRGEDIPVLVEGRIGIIERPDENGVSSPYQYIRELKEAGASGAIVGGGLATEVFDAAEALKSLQKASAA